MKYWKLKAIKKRYFGYEDIAGALGITPESARVTANRYTRQGLLVRVKRNMYVLSEMWETLTKEESFAMANMIQVPSYISLMTALDYYEVTTQIQRDFVESAAMKRTKEITASGRVYRFTKIAKKLYFGFSRGKGFFIAGPEKAFLDAVYLMSMGKYRIDLSSIDLGKLDPVKIRVMAKKFPKKTRKALERYGYIKGS